MKKTKINLLTYKSNYQKIEKYFLWLRTLAVIIGMILIVTVISFFISTKRQDAQIENLLTRKKTLLQQISNKTANEAKLIFIQKKYQTIQQFLQDDAHFLPYYNLLSSALSSSTQSAKLEGFQIDKQRNVDFKVSFGNLGELTDFFKFIESEKFLSKFENLSLRNYSAISKADKKDKSYQLSFIGRFIQLNDAKN